MDGEGEMNVGGFGTTHKKREFSEYDWFTTRTFQNELVESKKKFIKPQSEDPYYFYIPKNNDHWTRFHNTRLWGYLWVVKEVGGVEQDVAEEANKEEWSLVNNIYHAIWSQVVIKANGCEFEDTAASNYGWKSYFQTLLNTPGWYKQAVLEHNNAWIPDDHGRGDNMDLDFTIATGSSNSGDAKVERVTTKKADPTLYNSGWNRRRNGLKTGGKNYFSIPLYHDIMTSGKCFPPGTEFEIYLHRKIDDFVFLQSNKDEKYKIKLSNLMLSYDLREVTSEVNAYHAARKKNEIPRATIKKNYLKSYTCQQGATDMHRSQFFYSGKNTLPEQIIIFFMSQKRFNGQRDKNPFYWPLEFQLDEIGIDVNGHYVPERWLRTTTAEEKEYMYQYFLENIGLGEAHKTGSYIPVSWDDYWQNNFMIVIDRTNAKHHGYYDTIPDSGYIGIHLKLAHGASLPENYVVGVYASYSEDMYIEEDSIYFHAIEPKGIAGAS